MRDTKTQQDAYLAEDLATLNRSKPRSVSNVSLNTKDNSISFTLDNLQGGTDYQVKVKGLTGARGGATVEVSQGGKLLTDKPIALQFKGRNSFPAALGEALNSTVGSVQEGKREQMLNFSLRIFDTLDVREPNNLPLSKLSALGFEGMRDLANQVKAG